MKEYKLNITRPEFLKRFLLGSDDDHIITEEDMEREVLRHGKLIYACYSCIMEADLENTQIRFVSCDDDSCVVQMESKSMAKEVKECCNKETLRIGSTYYKLKVKVEGSYIFVSMEENGTVFDKDPD